MKIKALILLTIIDFLSLFEQCFENIAQSERRASIDAVIQGFLGMKDAHTSFAITRNQRTLDSSLGLSRRPCTDASLDRRGSESKFHRYSFLLFVSVIVKTVTIIIIIAIATALTVVGSLAFFLQQGIAQTLLCLSFP